MPASPRLNLATLILSLQQDRVPRMNTRKPVICASSPSRPRVPRVVVLPQREEARRPSRADRAEQQLRLRRLSARHA